MIRNIFNCDKSSFRQKEITPNYFFQFALLTCKFGICPYVNKTPNFGQVIINLTLNQNCIFGNWGQMLQITFNSNCDYNMSFFFNVYVFILRERKRGSMSGEGQTKRNKQNLKQSPCCQCRARHGARSHQP